MPYQLYIGVGEEIREELFVWRHGPLGPRPIMSSIALDLYDAQMEEVYAY